MTKIREEINLPLRVHPQPQPHLSPGGDCAACCIAGLCGIRPEQVYSRLMDGRVEPPSYPEYRQILEQALQLGLIRRYNTDVPFWTVPHYYMAFGPCGYISHPEWFRYLWMAFEAGYYGLASVSFNKEGSRGQVPPRTDHIVLLCGARQLEIPHPTLPGARIEDQVLVSCSAKSSPKEEWVPAQDFLSQRGGYNVILVKP